MLGKYQVLSWELKFQVSFFQLIGSLYDSFYVMLHQTSAWAIIKCLSSRNKINPIPKQIYTLCSMFHVGLQSPTKFSLFLCSMVDYKTKFFTQTHS